MIVEAGVVGGHHGIPKIARAPSRRRPDLSGWFARTEVDIEGLRSYASQVNLGSVRLAGRFRFGGGWPWRLDGHREGVEPGIESLGRLGHPPRWGRDHRLPSHGFRFGREHHCIIFQLVLDGMIGHYHDSVQHVLHRHMPEGQVELHDYRRQVNEFCRGGYRQTGGGINHNGRGDGTDIGIDQEIHPRLVRVALGGFLAQELQHFPKGQTVKSDFFQDNLFQLGLSLNPVRRFLGFTGRSDRRGYARPSNQPVTPAEGFLGLRVHRIGCRGCPASAQTGPPAGVISGSGRGCGRVGSRRSFGGLRIGSRVSRGSRGGGRSRRRRGRGRFGSIRLSNRRGGLRAIERGEQSQRGQRSFPVQFHRLHAVSFR